MEAIAVGSRRKQWLLGAFVSLVLVSLTMGTVFAHEDERTETVTRTNIAHLVNTHDNRFRSSHRMQTNRVNERNAVLTNEAYASAACNSCDDLSVAIQVNMIGPKIENLTANNFGDAVLNCSNCNVVTLAMQWNFISDARDWDDVPSQLRSFMNETDRLLDRIGRGDLTLADAVDGLNAIIAKYSSPAPAGPVHAALVRPGSPASQAGLHVVWKQATA